VLALEASERTVFDPQTDQIGKALVDVDGKFDENAVFKRQTPHGAVGLMHEMASIELDR
jgi:hypothetical protein